MQSGCDREQLAQAVLIALADPAPRELALLAAAARSGPVVAADVEGLGAGFRARLDARAGAVDTELARCAGLGLELVHWRDSRYPDGLRDLAHPPSVLYLRGRGPWPPARPVTIVGARRSTGLGRAFARELGEEVARRGGAVISGLARGIDQAAHEGALAAAGACHAVLACGLDQLYPPGAEELALRLLPAGRLISEMPLSTPPYRAHFPRRNRLLAALAPATIVVEADLRSGSLITAHHALDLGREVLAVPGALDQATSRGTNRLLQDGAYPLLQRGDLDYVLAPAPGQERLLALLRAGPQSLAGLCHHTGLAADELGRRLLDLEADGVVHRLGGGLYEGSPTATAPAAGSRRRTPPARPR